MNRGKLGGVDIAVGAVHDLIRVIIEEWVKWEAVVTGLGKLENTDCGESSINIYLRVIAMNLVIPSSIVFHIWNT